MPVVVVVVRHRRALLSSLLLPPLPGNVRKIALVIPCYGYCCCCWSGRQYGFAFRSLILQLLPIKFDAATVVIVVAVVVVVAVSSSLLLPLLPRDAVRAISVDYCC